MPGPAPKHASTRARRNKSSTAATLIADPDLAVPELHGDFWHPMTLEWWADLWSSPMAPEYDTSDRHGLYLLAMIVNDFWTATSPADRAKLAAEIRMQRNRYGLSPMDRRSLQWEIARAEEARGRSEKRTRTVDADSAPVVRSPGDPRSVLRAV